MITAPDSIGVLASQGNAARKPTTVGDCFDRSRALIENFSSIADDIERLADRVCGPVPDKPRDTVAAADIGNLISAFERINGGFSTQANRINEALNRLNAIL